MFDKRRFKAAQILSGFSNEEIADKLGINTATLYRKIRRDGGFKRREIQILYNIFPIENPDEIFFNECLANTQNTLNLETITIGKETKPPQFK